MFILTYKTARSDGLVFILLCSDLIIYFTANCFHFTIRVSSGLFKLQHVYMLLIVLKNIISPRDMVILCQLYSWNSLFYDEGTSTTVSGVQPRFLSRSLHKLVGAEKA